MRGREQERDASAVADPGSHAGDGRAKRPRQDMATSKDDRASVQPLPETLSTADSMTSVPTSAPLGAQGTFSSRVQATVLPQHGTAGHEDTHSLTHEGAADAAQFGVSAPLKAKKKKKPRFQPLIRGPPRR
jgi:hypothetical protein